MKFFKPLLFAATLLATALAQADVNVGVTVSATGPAASLGIPEKNTIALLPTTVAGQKINYIVLDDASDTTQAVSNTRKLITENKVDVIIGSSTTPNALAMIDVAAEAKTPMITLAASSRIIEPQDDKKRWVFKMPQNDVMMALARGRAHGGQRHQDGRLHRLLRRLRRRLVRGIHQGRRPSTSCRSSPTSASRAPTPRSPARS